MRGEAGQAGRCVVFVCMPLDLERSKPMDFKIIADRYDRGVYALRASGIDLWISLGRETSTLGEPALEMLLPFQVMGRTAVIITKDNKRICLVSPIEAEELQESGFFTTVLLCRTLDEFRYGLTETLAGLPDI